MSKRVLITGAGTGIGRDAAIELARLGHRVYATTHYSDESKWLNEYARDNELQNNLISFKLDLLLQEDRKKVLEYDIDVLINNAAIGDTGSVIEIPIDSYRRTFETNVFSVLELTQLALQNMIEKGKGRIVFVSSLAGRISMPFFSPYSATKFAIEGIAESLRDEVNMLENCDIDIVIIEPGAYATGFNQLNMEKKYVWMRDNSYFKAKFNKIKCKEQERFKTLEEKDTESIVVKYIRAVEANRPRFRYASPTYQSIVIQGLRLIGK